MSVIKDLVVDMSNFYEQLNLLNHGLTLNHRKEHLQSKEDRYKLDGLYEVFYVPVVLHHVHHIGGILINI